MKKTFLVSLIPASTNFNVNPYFADKDAAVQQAKVMAAQYAKTNPGAYNIVVFEGIAHAQVPVPNIDIIELK